METYCTSGETSNYFRRRAALARKQANVHEQEPCLREPRVWHKYQCHFRLGVKMLTSNSRWNRKIEFHEETKNKYYMRILDHGRYLKVTVSVRYLQHTVNVDSVISQEIDLVLLKCLSKFYSIIAQVKLNYNINRCCYRKNF